MIENIYTEENVLYDTKKYTNIINIYVETYNYLKLKGN